ncbi:hypothetical protein [Romeriopsis navalis]|uniref:hypothetical protein n=1 Tax=Romeriopsis navalis TaxID=2992132 RepID=UPI0021F83E60|nr:hypothetical protein [Romeriopsis navalis]
MGTLTLPSWRCEQLMALLIRLDVANIVVLMPLFWALLSSVQGVGLTYIMGFSRSIMNANQSV